MTVDRIVHLVVGLMVLVGIALAHYVNPDWIWLSVFMGFALAQSGITNICPMSIVLKKLGIKEGNCC